MGYETTRFGPPYHDYHLSTCTNEPTGARTSVLDEWVKEKGSEKEWFWWSEILMGIPGSEAFGFVVVALCLLADQTIIQAVWSFVVWGRLAPRLCSCELWTCNLDHLLDQWDTPLAAAAVLIIVHCRLHVPFRAFSTTSVLRGEVQSVKTRHLTILWRYSDTGASEIASRGLMRWPLRIEL